MSKYIIISIIVLLTFVTNSFTKKVEVKVDKNIDYKNTKTAYFAGGCFWGVEHHFEKKDGVKDVISGFMGGFTKDPSYYDVVKGNSGHVETVEVRYNPKEVSYEELTKLFFEIHDSTQKDGQGPDIGSQYLSAIFFQNKSEKQTAKDIIKVLKNKDYDVATSVVEKSTFYAAEGYHQNYYERTGKLPYCHVYTKIFD